MATYETRPQPIEAVQFLGFDQNDKPQFSEAAPWLDYHFNLDPHHPRAISVVSGLNLFLLVAHQLCLPGGWIIREVTDLSKIITMSNAAFSTAYRLQEEPSQ